MTEHEKLKFICDNIGIENRIVDGKFYYTIDRVEQILRDEREIIFTKEFMNKFGEIINIESKWFIIELLENLDKPVEYLYNLIK